MEAACDTRRLKGLLDLVHLALPACRHCGNIGDDPAHVLQDLGLAVLEFIPQFLLHPQPAGQHQHRRTQGDAALVERGVGHLHGRGPACLIPHGPDQYALAVQFREDIRGRAADVETGGLRAGTGGWADNAGIDKTGAGILNQAGHAAYPLRRDGIAIGEEDAGPAGGDHPGHGGGKVLGRSRRQYGQEQVRLVDNSRQAPQVLHSGIPCQGP